MGVGIVFLSASAKRSRSRLSRDSCISVGSSEGRVVMV